MEPQNKKTIKTVVYYLGFIILGMSYASLGPTLPGLARNTGSMLGDISWLFVLYSAGYGISSLLGGRLYDRFPGHPIMAASLAVIAITMAVIPIVTRLSLLVTIFFIRGLASGACDVGGNTLIVWVHGDRFGSWCTFLHFCFGAGGLLAPVIVAQALVLTGDFALAYWIIAVFTLPVSILTPCIKSPRIIQTSDSSVPRSARMTLVILITLFFFLHVGVQVTYSGWIYTYAVHWGILKEAQAAYLTSIFWGALTVGRLASVPIASRVAPARILLVNLTGCFLSMVLLLLFPERGGILWAGTTIMGFSMSTIFPGTILFASTSMKISGKGMGIFLIGAQAGSMIVPWIFGQIFERSSPRVLSEFLLITITAAFIVLLIMRVKTAGLQKKAETVDG